MRDYKNEILKSAWYGPLEGGRGPGTFWTTFCPKTTSFWGFFASVWSRSWICVQTHNNLIKGIIGKFSGFNLISYFSSSGNQLFWGRTFNYLFNHVCIEKRWLTCRILTYSHGLILLARKSNKIIIPFILWYAHKQVP